MRDSKMCKYCHESYCASCIGSAVVEAGKSCYGQETDGSKCDAPHAQRSIREFLEPLEIECSICHQTIRYPDFDAHSQACAKSCDSCGMWNNGRDHNCVDDIKSFSEHLKLSYSKLKEQYFYKEKECEEKSRRIQLLETEVLGSRTQSYRETTQSGSRGRRTIDLRQMTNHTDNSATVSPSGSSVAPRARPREIELAANDVFQRIAATKNWRVS